MTAAACAEALRPPSRGVVCTTKNKVCKATSSTRESGNMSTHKKAASRNPTQATSHWAALCRCILIASTQQIPDSCLWCQSSCAVHCVA
jgi:hypothetical protein